MDGIREMTTGIVILNFNNFNDTINCIKSIEQHCSEQKMLLAIVDNGSSNDSADQISTFLNNSEFVHLINSGKPSLKSSLVDAVIIQPKDNLGYAKGTNLGINFLIERNVDHIVVLNNDILFTSNIITPMVDCLNSQPDLGLVSPLLFKDDSNIEHYCCRKSPTIWMIICECLSFLKVPGTKKIVSRKFLLKKAPDLLNNQIIYCDLVSGSCIMAKTETWEELDGFDEETFLYYEEDILYEKLKKLNLKTALLTTITAIHLGARSTNNTAITKILMINTDSLLYYLKTYRNTGILVRILIKSLRLLYIYLLTVYIWGKSVLTSGA